MKKNWLGLAAVVLAALAPTTAAAQDFVACDGYGDPKPKGDGMTTSPLLWGLAKGNADIRDAPLFSFGADGVAACDRALADARLLPAYQLRRAHLLQGKAVHQIGAGQAEAALETLARSDEIGEALEGPYFRDSVGLGNHAVRGFALIALGRKAEAIKEIETIEQARPDAPSMVRMAALLRMRLDSSLAAQLALLKRQAVRDPNALLRHFVIALTAGKFDEATAVGGSLSFELPANHGGWTVEGDSEHFYDVIGERADLMGAYAYALAATGQTAKSAAVIAKARQDLIEAAAPPPVPEPGRTLSKSVMRDFDNRRTVAGSGSATLDIWVQAIAIRQKAATMTGAEMLAALKSLPRNKLPVMADLIRQIRTPDAADDAARRSAIARIDAATEQSRLKTMRLDVSALHDMLPRPETSAMQPSFKHAGDGYFLSDNGFSRKRLEDPNSWTVRFTHNLASKATVEELALLSAATLARKEGFDGLIVQSRRTLERTTHLTGMYIAPQDIPTGNEAQLNVLLVKGGVLPDEFRDAGWRVLNADAVIGELSGRYVAAGVVKAK